MLTLRTLVMSETLGSQVLLVSQQGTAVRKDLRPRQSPSSSSLASSRVLIATTVFVLSCAMLLSHATLEAEGFQFGSFYYSYQSAGQEQLSPAAGADPPPHRRRDDNGMSGGFFDYGVEDDEDDEEYYDIPRRDAKTRSMPTPMPMPMPMPVPLTPNKHGHQPSSTLEDFSSDTATTSTMENVAVENTEQQQQQEDQSQHQHQQRSKRTRQHTPEGTKRKRAIVTMATDAKYVIQARGEDSIEFRFSPTKPIFCY